MAESDRRDLQTRRRKAVLQGLAAAKLWSTWRPAGCGRGPALAKVSCPAVQTRRWPCQPHKAFKFKRLRWRHPTAGPVLSVSDALGRGMPPTNAWSPPSLGQPDSSNHPNPRARQLPQSSSLDAAQQAFVGLPGAASGDKASGRIDDGPSVAGSRSFRFQQIVHTRELLDAYALDVQQTVTIDVEDGERPVQHARRFAVHQFHDDAGLAHAPSGEVGNTGDVFPPQHSHESRAGQRVQGVVSREQEQLR